MAAVSSRSLKAVVVGFGRHNSLKFADFYTCILDQLSAKENSIRVDCQLSDNVLRLSYAGDSSSSNEQHNPHQEHIEGLSFVLCDDTNIGNAVLEHSPECPLKQMANIDCTNLSHSHGEKFVMLAVAVLLESCDGKVLMTQRAEHMRSFPRAWVPPGGHVEPDESIVSCGLRELKEEAGLELKLRDIKLNVLCMWESVYPPLLVLGQPRNHHLVIYLLAKSPLKADELQSQIKLDPEEVMANTWFTPETVQRLTKGEDETMDVYILDNSEPKGVKLIKRNLSSMFKGALLWKLGEVYSGTQQALTRWSETKSGCVSKI